MPTSFGTVLRRAREVRKLSGTEAARSANANPACGGLNNRQTAATAAAHEHLAEQRRFATAVAADRSAERAGRRTCARA